MPKTIPENLVAAINLAVISALAPLMDKNPALSEVLNRSALKHQATGLFSDWDFFMTIAGVGCYMLENDLSDDDEEIILDQLLQLDKQMVAGLKDFMGFISNKRDPA